MVVLLLPHGCSLMHLHNVAHRILTSFRPDYPSVYVSIRLPVCPSLRVSVRLSVCLSVSICLFVCLPVGLSVSP